MKKLKLLLILLLMITISCSSDDDSISSDNPALNECLGTAVPFPAQASINACITLENGIGVVFNPGISWEESISFFSTNYNTGGWSITRHEIFGENTGEREAEWSIVGPEFDVEISITAFGNDNTGFIVGRYIIYY